jgi:hypothetical protein
MRKGKMIEAIRRLLPWLVLVLLAACASASSTPSFATVRIGTMTAAEYRNQTATYRPTETELPTETNTPKPTNIPTVLPMVTPSPGPAPDLEVFNGTIFGNIFMGEIRNNTDQPMIFPGEENALILGFEDWHVAEGGNGGYHHNIFYPVKLQPLNQNMNCILFPKETGVVLSHTNSACDECIQSENVPAVTQLGYRLISSEGIFHRWEEFKTLELFRDYPSDLDERFHPQVQNLEYDIQIIKEMIEGSAILFNFDIELFLPEYIHGAFFPSWAILYDKDGRIINVLYVDNINFCNNVQCLKSGKFHVFGAGCNKGKCLFANWATPDQLIQWYQPEVEITTEDLQRVDHVRMIVEIADWDICVDRIWWE